MASAVVNRGAAKLMAMASARGMYFSATKKLAVVATSTAERKSCKRRARVLRARRSLRGDIRSGSARTENA